MILGMYATMRDDFYKHFRWPVDVERRTSESWDVKYSEDKIGEAGTWGICETIRDPLAPGAMKGVAIHMKEMIQALVDNTRTYASHDEEVMIWIVPDPVKDICFSLTKPEIRNPDHLQPILKKIWEIRVWVSLFIGVVPKTNEDVIS